jgi:hypothetical protein
MQSVFSFMVRQSVRAYGVPRLYKDLLKMNRQHVYDTNVRYNIMCTLRQGFRSNWDPEVMFNNPNVQYLLLKSNIESNRKLNKLYSYIKEYANTI